MPEFWERIPYDNILIIAAHPDDEFLGCGGTILKALNEKKKVHICFTTDGSKYPPWNGKEINKERRLSEIKKIYEKLKISGLYLLNFEDDFLFMHKHSLKEVLAWIIKDLKPDLILTHFPDKHKDHVIVHETVTEVCTFLNPKPKLLFFLPYGGKLIHQPRVVVDISEYYQKKIKILKEYKSQLFVCFPYLLIHIFEDLFLQSWYKTKVEVFL